MAMRKETWRLADIMRRRSAFMVYKGRIKNGVVVIEGGSRPPEGAEVNISVVADDQSLPGGNNVDRSSLRRLLLSVAGKAQGLPSDAAKNIDHYLYGLPKV